MPQLTVDYRKLNDFNSSANHLIDIYRNRAEDYENISSGISRTSNSAQAHEARRCLQNKTNTIRDRMNRLQRFNQRTTQLVDEAQAKDRYVASRIVVDSCRFARENNIQINPVKAAFALSIRNKKDFLNDMFGTDVTGTLDRFVRDAKYGIKNWYRNGGKYVVEIAKGVLTLVAAIALVVSTGGGIIAIFGAMKAAADLYYDMKAGAQYYTTGNRAQANRTGKKGAIDVATVIGGEIGYQIGGEEGRQIGQKIGKGAFVLCEVACFAHTIIKGGISFKKDFKRIKSMGMMQGKSNFKVFQQTVLKKTINNNITKDIKIGGIKIKTVNITSILFPKPTIRKGVVNFVNTVIKTGKSYWDKGSSIIGMIKKPTETKVPKAGYICHFATPKIPKVQNTSFAI